MNVPVSPAVVVRVPRQVVWRGLRITCAGADEAKDSAASKAMTSKRTYDTVARPNMLLLSASMTNLLPGRLGRVAWLLLLGCCAADCAGSRCHGRQTGSTANATHASL